MKVLIIRSASMERFDCLMSSMSLQTDGTVDYDVLTHPHAAAGILANYPNVNVIEYRFKGDFNRKNVERTASKGKFSADYDKIVVLVSNLSGKGHHNVINSALLLGEKVELFNINGEFIAVKKSSFIREKFIRLLLSPLVISATLLFSIWGAIKLIAGLSLNSRKKAARYGEAAG